VSAAGVVRSGTVVVSVGIVSGGGAVLVPVPESAGSTVIVPVMPCDSCTAQKNLYVPAALKTCEFVRPVHDGDGSPFVNSSQLSPVVPGL
jgi:hypothetical protein